MLILPRLTPIPRNPQPRTITKQRTRVNWVARCELLGALRIDPGHTAAAAELARLEAGERQQD